MTTTQTRQEVVTLIDKALKAGASRERACQVVGISTRTFQRWRPPGTEQMQSDQRPIAQRSCPANKLTPEERAQVLDICNQPEYASLPPSQIVPKLADNGIYVASESTFYRILKAEGQLHHRGRARKPRPLGTPPSHVADGPNQVWTWDITWLPSGVRGRFYYLYLVEDLYSRYAVNWEVHDCESGELATELIHKALFREQCHTHRPILHSDNGSPMKSQTLRTKLQEWGIAPSYSRPGVSDDNAYVESFFRTMKYCPKWPAKGFSSLEEAREWAQRFMEWYNHEHQYSRIRFVTPVQRHRGEDKAILEKRTQVYAAAQARHSYRWSGDIRNWTPVASVALNPVNRPDFLEKAS